MPLSVTAAFRRDELAAMTPEQLLAEARCIRLVVQAREGKLIVRGPKDADQEFVDALLARKAEVMPVLLGASLDERQWAEERAAIAEFDGGLSRADAERLAWAELEVLRQQYDNDA